MNYSYNFNPAHLLERTKDLPVAAKFSSWRNVVRTVAELKFNIYEAEAIAYSALLDNAIKHWKKAGKPTSGAVVAYFKDRGIVPGCGAVNWLVMDRFGKKYNLELNDKGQPCRRGTMPGNYSPDRTILVPLGTPACCDPSSETYWRM